MGAVHSIISRRGGELAAGIPGARFVALPGRNHVILEQDPGLPLLLRGTERVLEERNLGCRSIRIRRYQTSHVMPAAGHLRHFEREAGMQIDLVALFSRLLAEKFGPAIFEKL